MEKAWVYILRCADGTLYTGWTSDLSARVDAHNRGRGARYTSSRLPVALVYEETLPTRGDALRRETAIKKLSRARKEKLLLSGGGEGPSCLGKHGGDIIKEQKLRKGDRHGKRQSR